MTTYVLDSDVVIDILKGVTSSIAFVQSLQADGSDLATCAVVVAEVFSGLKPRDKPTAVSFMANLHYLDIPRGTASRAGEWRYAHAREGIILSTSDVLVAATVTSHGAILVTGNVRHYPMRGIQLAPLPRGQVS
jgi:predicted nucleic acid-binding protein